MHECINVNIVEYVSITLNPGNVTCSPGYYYFFKFTLCNGLCTQLQNRGKLMTYVYVRTFIVKLITYTTYSLLLKSNYKLCKNIHVFVCNPVNFRKWYNLSITCFMEIQEIWEIFRKFRKISGNSGNSRKIPGKSRGKIRGFFLFSGCNRL